ncbi:hypothetical protein DFP72DRAFT_1071212 [Ephemerocybe angulata]|uniref:Uncharacterized protein n=1 Tax=Ephemerocybe angulata TaxID=980116 RepID=A0A8H6M448_9AGAR|nr:hypothetical protein DFP72DRAFT_1071212 [Tulosesus angulatus]
MTSTVGPYNTPTPFSGPPKIAFSIPPPRRRLDPRPGGLENSVLCTRSRYANVFGSAWGGREIGGIESAVGDLDNIEYSTTYRGRPLAAFPGSPKIKISTPGPHACLTALVQQANS